MEGKMNKQDCKKYIKRAYKNLINSNKEITPDNMEKEMIKEIKKQGSEYIAYSKIAVSNMLNSANSLITLNDLLEEIDVLVKIYPHTPKLNR